MKRAESPTISVIMPVRNASESLEVAVNSILRQTFDDFELIVVNDHSTDESESILGGFQDRRIQLRPNTGKAGVAFAFNTGLEAARGRYVARMDADDISLPDRLATQLAYLEQHPEVDIVGASINLLEPNGRLSKDRSIRPTLPTHLRWSLLFYCSVAFPTVMARRQTLLDLGGCDSQHSPADDYDLWLRAVEAGIRVTNIPKVLLNYRINPTGLSHSPGSNMSAITLALSQRALARFLHSREPVEPTTLQVLREPAEIRAVDDFEGAVAKAIRLLEDTIKAMDEAGADVESLSAIELHAATYANRLILNALKASPGSSMRRVRESRLLTGPGLAGYAVRAAGRRTIPDIRLRPRRRPH